MTDTFQIQAPSGATRLAAAKELFRHGKISAEVLEFYRISSCLAAPDASAVLAELGASPLAEGATPEELFRHFIAEADLYFATLPGPGVAEVRAALARWASGPVTLSPRPNAVIAAHLGDALASLAPTHPSLARAIAAAAPYLTWKPYDSYPVEDIGLAFARGQAYASLIGEDSTIPAQGYDLGLFLIAPHLLYRDHHHAAPELYAPLTGPHGWRFGPGTALQIKPAHQPVWNESFAPHLTKVGPLPFLALFGWTADVTVPAVVIPAEDWPALEALRLG